MKQTDEQIAKKYADNRWDRLTYSYEQTYLDGIKKGRELSDEKAMRFAEWTSANRFHYNSDSEKYWKVKSFIKDEIVDATVTLFTTEELYTSKEFEEYLNEFKK